MCHVMGLVGLVRSLPWLVCMFPPLPSLDSGPRLAQAQPPEPLTPIPVELGDAPAVTPKLQGDAAILAPKEKVNAMEVQVELEEKLSAPVEEGQQVGRMVVTSGGEVLTELPLVADRAVARLTYWQILERCLRRAFLGG